MISTITAMLPAEGPDLRRTTCDGLPVSVKAGEKFFIHTSTDLDEALEV